MSAKHLYRVSNEGTYSHIYNKGVDNRVIFNDDLDYQVFIGYLKDYLSAPADPESIKRIFTVNGRTFRGTPHQPKNYFDKVEMIAYSLKPNRFNLILHQLTKNSIESFLKSLCTRYSIYFNKKYQRSGSLFEGPYKSVHIKDQLSLLYLTRYLNSSEYHSSFAEYVGLRATSWIKPDVVLNSFIKLKERLPRGAGDYKYFVDKYQLDENEKKLLRSLTLESDIRPLERYTPTQNLSSHTPINANNELTRGKRIPEFLAIIGVFVILFTFGIHNINANQSVSHSIATSEVLGESIPSTSPSPSIAPLVVEVDISPLASPSPSPTAVPAPIAKVIIKINDGSPVVNIREKPNTNSKKISESKDSETFELISNTSGWYEIRLSNDLTGFVSVRYAFIEE